MVFTCDPSYRTFQTKSKARVWYTTVPEETYLAEHFSKPVFVLNYPKAIKPFYMKPKLSSWCINAISGSIIQNSIKWRRVLDFSALNVGPTRSHFGYEIEIEDIELVGQSEDYPITPFLVRSSKIRSNDDVSWIFPL